MSEFAHALRLHCPTVAGATEIARVAGTPERHQAARQGGSGRVSGELVLERWKGGKAAAEEAIVWARMCADSHALGEIARRERRSSVCAEVAANPNTAADALAIIVDRHKGTNAAEAARKRLIEWVGTAPLHAVLDLLDAHARLVTISSSVTSGLLGRDDLDRATVHSALAGRSTVAKYVAEPLLANRDAPSWCRDDLALLCRCASLQAALRNGIHAQLPELLDQISDTDPVSQQELWQIVAAHDASGPDVLRRAARHGNLDRPPLLWTCSLMAWRDDAPLDLLAECSWGEVAHGRGGAAITARLLVERFGDDHPEAWLVAASLGDDWNGTAGALVDTVATLLDSAAP